MLVTAADLPVIMERLNGQEYPAIFTIAQLYITKQLKAEPTSQTKTLVASRLIGACQDFLMRDGTELAHAYEGNAETLEKAVFILRRDAQYFESMLAVRGLTDPRQDGVVQWALEQMAERYHEIAHIHDRDKRNITFFYCVGRAFFDWALPSARQAHDIYLILCGILGDVCPHALSHIKTTYDPSAEGSEIRRLMRAGQQSPQ